MMSNKRPYTIGLTGGIACGKSAISSYLKDQGYTVLDADELYHKTMEKGGPAYEALISHYGQEILSERGEIDRKKLSALVFSDPKEKDQLEAITHPIIFRAFIDQYHSIAHEDLKDGFIFFDIPLLFESKKLREKLQLDSIWLVAASEKTQVKRLKKRNGFSPSEAITRIRAQMPLEKKKVLSDQILYNEKDLASLHKQIDQTLIKEKENYG